MLPVGSVVVAPLRVFTPPWTNHARAKDYYATFGAKRQRDYMPMMPLAEFLSRDSSGTRAEPEIHTYIYMYQCALRTVMGLAGVSRSPSISV